MNSPALFQKCDADASCERRRFQRLQKTVQVESRGILVTFL